MRLPWTRLREARIEREKAEAMLEQIRAQRPAVLRHSGQSEHHERVNHIAENVYAMFRGTR